MTALDLPSWRAAPDDPTRVRDRIDVWAESPAVDAVVSAFGGVIPARHGLDRLRWLDEFAATHWDFRGGRERNQARERALTPVQTGVALSTAGDLGLSGREVPLQDAYDVVLMTGGMVRAGIVKPRFAAELIAGGLAVGHVVFLGAFRAFAGDESALAAALGVRGGGEFDAMVAGMERAFGPLGPPEVFEDIRDASNASWREYSWVTPERRLSVIAAPSSDPTGRRANSADTYRFWAERRRRVGEHSVLQVTTPIYVPYQAAVAVEILGLGHGLPVETVGVSTTASDLGANSQPFLAQHYLQELRSAIGALHSLRQRLDA
jgi:hypothetical protein